MFSSDWRACESSYHILPDNFSILEIFVRQQWIKTFIYVKVFSGFNFAAEKKTYKRKSGAFAKPDSSCQKIVITNDDADCSAGTARHIRFRDSLQMDYDMMTRSLCGNDSRQGTAR